MNEMIYIGNCYILIQFFYYVGNIVRNLYRRYDGITRKSTAGCAIAEGDFLIYSEGSALRALFQFIRSAFSPVSA